jgi:hypothetical protein
MSSRDEFEATWADVMRGDEPLPGNKPLRSTIDPDIYRGDAVNFAWKWWQRSRAQETMFSKEELNLFRQWFNAMEDLSPSYIEKSDCDLYRKVMELLK